MFENPTVRWVYHLLMCLSSFCAFFWMAIILKGSPIEMKHFKWVLFKLALMEELFAIFLGMFLQPDPLFPAQCAAILGLASYFGQFAARLSLAMTFFFGMSIFISINDCVHFRSLIIHQKHAIIAKIMKPYIGIPMTLSFKCFLAVPLFYVMFMAFEETEDLIPRMKEYGYYQYMAFYVDRGAIFLSMDVKKTWSIVTAGIVLFGLVAIYFSNLFSALILFRELHRLQSHMAEKTYRANLAILYMLFSQNMYPVIVLFLPIAVTVYGFAFDMSLIASDLYKHLSLCGILMFPTMSCLTSLCFMKPYRDYLKRFFCPNLRLKRNREVSTTNLITVIS